MLSMWLRIGGVVLLLVGWAGAKSGDRRTIAVLYFQNNALIDKELMAPLEKGLADMLITELSKIDALKVVERARLQQLIEEMGLASSGAIEANTAQQMGKLLGAETLLLGSFATDLKGEKLRLDARIVETETGLTLKAEEITDKTKSLFKMVEKLVEKIAKQLDIDLTKEDKEQLKKPGGRSFQAVLHYSKGLDLEDRGEYEKALEMYRKALEADPEYDKARRQIAVLETTLGG